MKQFLEMLNIPVFYLQKTPITLHSFIELFLVFLAVYFVSHLAQRMLRKNIFPVLKITDDLQHIFLKLIHYSLVFVGILLGLDVIGFNLSTLAVIGGLLGVGIGIGLQNVVSNFISGLLLLFERPIKIGDRITLGNLHGDVMEINIRSTTLLTPDNVAVIIPSSDLINGRIENWSYGHSVLLHIPFCIGYESDIYNVKALLLQAARDTLGMIRTDPPPDVLMKSFGGQGIALELLVWIGNAKMAGRIVSDLNYKVYQLFTEHQIKMFVPRQEIYLPIDKQ